MGVSIRGYAAHRGVGHTSVRKAIASGRVSLEPDGSIDLEKADRSWVQNADPSKTRASPKLKPVPEAAVTAVRETLSESGSPLVGGMSYLHAKMAEKVLTVQLLREKLRRRSVSSGKARNGQRARRMIPVRLLWVRAKPRESYTSLEARSAFLGPQRAGIRDLAIALPFAEVPSCQRSLFVKLFGSVVRSSGKIRLIVSGWVDVCRSRPMARFIHRSFMALVALPFVFSTIGAADDRGDFVVVYDPPQSGALTELAGEVARSGFLEEVADELNLRIALPHDVRMVFTECGQSNAFYSAADKTISMCYELIADFNEALAGVTESEAEHEDAVIGASYFFLFHELGHALIDVLDLPAVGREEDAVDQLAAVILLDEPSFRDDGAASVIATATTFAKWAEAGAQDFTNMAFYDEHSLDAVRFYNLLCWAYGSDQTRYRDILLQALPEARAKQCPDEFAGFVRAWEKLLAPHMK